jgi:hypothetical protein
MKEGNEVISLVSQSFRRQMQLVYRYTAGAFGNLFAGYLAVVGR